MTTEIEPGALLPAMLILQEPFHVTTVEPHPGHSSGKAATYEVLELIGTSRSTFDRLIMAGRFPAPVQLGSTNRWLESEVATFSEQLKAARAAKRA